MAGSALSDQPRPIRGIEVVGLATVVTAAVDYIIASTGLLLPTSQGAGQGAWDWRARDWSLYLKTMYQRIRLMLYTTGTAAPGQSAYATLMACSPSTANAGALILGAEVDGARGPTVSLAATGTRYELTGPDAPVPADGMYCAVLHANAAWAANSGAILLGYVDTLAR